MRWIARRRTAWAVAAWAAACGLADAGPLTRHPYHLVKAPLPMAPAVDLVAPPVETTLYDFEMPTLISTDGAPARAPAKSSGDHPMFAESGPVPREVSPFEQAVRATPAVSALTVEHEPHATVTGPRPQAFPPLGMFLVPPEGHDSLRSHLIGEPDGRSDAWPAFALQPPSGFDVDHRYLTRKDNEQVDLFDAAKNLPLFDDVTVSFGGQHSIRSMHETNSRLSRFDDEYLLYRNRLWADVWYEDTFRLYGEVIDARIAGNDLPPLAIDENHVDVLNAFVDVKVGTMGGAPAYLRLGRQELLFGSQRLVSTNDWANTRRTFEGARAFWRSDFIDADIFAVRPVRVDPRGKDEVDEEVDFFGAWLTFRPRNQVVDVYCLGFSDGNNRRDALLPAGVDRFGQVDIKTVGARWAGKEGPYLWDIEAMKQTGDYVGRDHEAFAGTVAVGYSFDEMHWRPQVWASCDYASGTDDPLGGTSGTFQQLYPYGHHYFGFVDQVGRQNIKDLSLQVAAFPEEWVTLVAQVHKFELAERSDALYNAAGRATRRDITGRAGRDVGTEIDLLANFHLTPHQDVLVGFSKLFAGDFIAATGPDVSPELLYVMYNLRW